MVKKSKIHRSDKEFIKLLKESYKLNDDVIRRFYYILSSKEKDMVFDEYLYFRHIYNIETNDLFDCLINKYIKIKYHNHQYEDIKKDVKQYADILEAEYKYHDMFGVYPNIEMVNKQYDIMKEREEYITQEKSKKCKKFL